jgi:peptidoglycan/xylan/chitin deacetylase (PgdA/CDA1 family)
MLIVHRDVRGKAFVLIVMLALALGTFNFAQHAQVSRVEARVNAVDTLNDVGKDAAGDKARSADLRVLDYQVPRPKKSSTASDSALEMMRENGLLRGYSVPSRRLVFEPDGGSIILPPSPQVQGPREVSVIRHGSRKKKRVALTLDTSDVGEAKAARAIIDELTRLRAPATLFVCGAWCYKNPDLLRLAVDRGFEIANHSFNHPYFTRISNEEIVSQIRSTETAVWEVSGTRISSYLRPPYGATDARVEQVVAQLGYASAMWSIDTNDWRESTIRENIRDRATVGARGGDIVLMHTLGSYTDDALVEIVSNLRANGFELTTLTGVMQP